ncbi:MAG: flagellar hook-associated protein FlgK [Burkholderiaceae bacterium]
MGASTLMSVGMRAMAANFAALQTAGHNIANANVEGYSRQQVELATAQGQDTGAGFFGRGVDIETVTRSHNAFLTREAAAASSQSAADAARLAQLDRLEAVFPTGVSGLGYAAGEFLNSMVDLASRPQDSSTRQVVLARADDVASRFSAAAAQLDNLQTGVSQDLQNGVAAVNGLAQRIAQVNDSIAQAQGSGQPPNDLLDQRDQLIAELSEHLQVTTIAADDGTLGVFMAGGQRLVLGTQASTLRLLPDAFDVSRSRLAVIESGIVRPLPEGVVGSGSLGGLLRFQNEDLVAARNQLGQMATALSTAVNAQQALGLDLRTPAGSGGPLLVVGAPTALPASTNGRDAAGNFISSVSLAVADAQALQASEYALRTDPANAGSYLLTRLSDGLERSIASGDTVDGLTVTVGPPAPAATDRFLLQPFTRAANEMRSVMSDPRGLAAASPLEAVRDVANAGTARVAALTIADASVNPQLTASIDFSDANGSYSWTLRDQTTNALVSSGAGSWSAGVPIALNGFELQLDGVPAAGDTFSVARTASPQASNGNALALAALRDAALVGGRNVTDAYASLIAGVGVKVQSARTSADISEGVAASARAQQTGEAGVNLDEEAARLLQFQQSYQAAAKILQVAQSLFDTLLDVTR